MPCLSQCSGTVDRLSGPFVPPLWHRSHSQALLSTRLRQFLFTLFFSYFSLIPHSRFQEHMSLRSALLIRGLFCLWVSLFFALVVDGIVTGVSVGVLPSRQKVFIGLLMSLPRVVCTADLCPEWTEPDFSHQGVLSLQFRVFVCKYLCLSCAGTQGSALS